jgi:hypothetical protein
MVELNDAIETFRREHGFSQQAWEMFRDSQAEQQRLEAENDRLRTKVQEATALLDFEANLGDPKRAPALREVVKQLTEALED